MQLSGVVLFHLNLCYSSISKERRAEVVRQCYWPMLELLDQVPDLMLAVEASGHTLELIAALDPSWIEALRREVRVGRVEFIGSGDTQLIGPLVPAEVNRWNQRLGQESYERLIGARARTALVNEMAWSQGMVEHYLDAGYEAVVMEWNNPRLQHPEWPEAWRHQSVRTASPSGREIGLHWADTAAFQKLQRVAFGEIEFDEYADWVDAQVVDERALFLYAGDAEIFDFRPGRYDTEPPRAEESEWTRIAQALRELSVRGVRFTTPAQLWRQSAWSAKPLVRLTSCADPVPVKKQPKYNLTRWALSGRDDMHLNAHCFARAAALERTQAGAREWRELCRLWGSDLRTHLSLDRWQDVQTELGAPQPALAAVDSLSRERTRERATTGPSSDSSSASQSTTNLLQGLGCEPRVTREGRRLELSVAGAHVSLNLRRGLAIESARFDALGPHPLFGTLPHGTFDHIHWAADFYSGHTVFEVPGMRRIADLELVEPRHRIEEGAIVVEALVPTPLGPLPKRIRLSEAGIELHYGFSAWGARPRGSLRTAYLTFMPDFSARGLELRCAQGGLPETFPVDGEFDHGRGLSAFVSAAAAFGASEGPLQLLAGDVQLELDWCRERCPVLPMLSRARVDGKLLLRLAFSLEEVDDTSSGAAGEPRAAFPDFDLHLSVHPALHPVYQ